MAPVPGAGANCAERTTVWPCCTGLAGTLSVRLSGSGAIVKPWLTGSAGAYAALPGWFAVMVQDPTPVSVTILPLTVHDPDAVKLTGRPEEAVAATGNGALP